MHLINWTDIDRHKTFVVPISGGLDSTYLFYDLVRHHYRVIPFHVHIRNDYEPEKCGKEMIAITNIISAMKSVMPWTPDVRIAMYSHAGPFGFGRDTEVIYMTAQKIIYDIAIDPSHTDIMFIEGVIMDDLVIPEFRNRFEERIDFKLWESIVNAMKYRILPMDLAKIRTDLWLPYIDNFVDKALVILDMPSYIYEHIWWCRSPIDDQPCGVCNSCKIHNGALNLARIVNPDLNF